jgi:hypothetical protein
MFSLILSQALLMSKLSSKLSKAANLFEISTWYFSLTSTSSSFFRSNLSKLKFCLARLLTYLLKFSNACIIGEIWDNAYLGKVRLTHDPQKNMQHFDHRTHSSWDDDTRHQTITFSFKIITMMDTFIFTFYLCLYMSLLSYVLSLLLLFYILPVK